MSDTELAVFLAFLNSHDLHDADALAVPESYACWVEGEAPEGLLDATSETARALLAVLRELAGPAPDAADPAELAQARDLRDGVIALLVDADETTASELDRVVAGLPLRLRVDRAARVAIEPAARGPLAIATRALVALHDAMADGTAERLRLCRADDCHWAFIDRSRNGSRVWCDMAACGARAKARAYRRRRGVAG